MDMNNRIELIHLLSEELYATAKRYETAKREQKYAIPGYNIESLDSKEAIKRRVTVLREELLKLAKTL